MQNKSCPWNESKDVLNIETGMDNTEEATAFTYCT